jgi:proline racemase
MRHTFFCIDGHTAGNPVRLVAGGAPLLKGASMSERRQDFLARFDWIRTGLCFEPRGHDMMSGGFLYPPTTADADIGILFIETSGCLPMCGHGTIGIVTFGLEHGLIQPAAPGRLRVEVPAGVIDIAYETAGDKVTAVRITNVPSFVATTGIVVDVDGIGPLSVDVAYGGNYYAIVEPQGAYTGLDDLGADRIIALSRGVRAAVRQPRSMGRPAEGRGGGRSQRGLLRRQGDRPFAVRHRYLGAPRASDRQGRARGRRPLRPRKLYRQPLHRPGRGGDDARRHARDRAVDRGIGDRHRLQHDLDRSCRHLLGGVPGHVTVRQPGAPR